jgi:hypothetical protein
LAPALKQHPSIIGNAPLPRVGHQASIDALIVFDERNALDDGGVL